MIIIGKKIELDFGIAKALMSIHSDTSLTFTILEKEGIKTDITETVEIKITEIRPQIFMTTWKEINGNTITQIQDYENGIVYSNWTTPNGEFINRTGTLKLVD